MKNKRFYQKPILFNSAKKIGVIDADGSNEYYFDFRIPFQESWGIGPVFGSRRRAIFTSYEDTLMKNLVAGNVMTHSWIHDFKDSSMLEILARDRPAPYIGCCGIFEDQDELLWTALIDGENILFISNFDGTQRRALTSGGEGFIYGVSLDQRQERIAFHITGSKKMKEKYHRYRPGPYAINVMDITGNDRRLVAGTPGHLYFGPDWSPDGLWLAYLDCLEEEDPAHFAADICVGKPDGSVNKILTSGQIAWFGTSHGSENNRSGGSNMVKWSPDSKRVLFARLLQDSHPDCYYDASLPNHEELVFAPHLARGGSNICTVDPESGIIQSLTKEEEGKWEHHANFTSDGEYIVFSRAYVGLDNELWIMKSDGSEQQFLTKGFEKKGAISYSNIYSDLVIPIKEDQ
jgi:hypothetical protein